MSIWRSLNSGQTLRSAPGTQDNDALCSRRAVRWLSNIVPWTIPKEYSWNEVTTATEVGSEASEWRIRCRRQNRHTLSPFFLNIFFAHLSLAFDLVIRCDLAQKEWSIAPAVNKWTCCYFSDVKGTSSSHATRQKTLGHSCLSSLSHCRPILA